MIPHTFEVTEALKAPKAALRQSMGGDFNVERTMSPRILLIALLAAFGFATLFATLTTVRQIHVHTSAMSQPMDRG